MASLPNNWKLEKNAKDLSTFVSDKYIIYLWKKKKEYIVETFRKGPNYKTRLFSQTFLNLRDAKKFSKNIMKRDRIRKY